MVLTKLKSEGIKDGEVKNADMADDAVGVAELSATGTASSSTFLRGDNSWAIPTDTNTVTTINNNADNRVITGSGTANTLEGEANLTYDGSHLSIATDASTEGIKITSTGNTYNELSFDANRTSAGAHIGRIVANWDGTAVSYISMDAGDDTTNKDDGIIRFWTAADGNGNYERVRIQAAGLTFNGDTAAANALDDYEEGNWTPTVSSGMTSPTYSHQRGGYVKIGRLVYFQFDIAISGGTGNSNHLKIGGLPFTSESSANYAYSGAFMNYQNSFLDQGSDVTLHIGLNSTDIKFYKWDGNWMAGNSSALNDLTANIIVNGLYMAAS